MSSARLRKVCFFLPVCLQSLRYMSKTMVPPVKCSRVSSRSYEFWPSDLQRAGHTTVQVDEDEPLGQHLEKIGKHEVYGVHMAGCKNFHASWWQLQNFAMARIGGGAQSTRDPMVKRLRWKKLERLGRSVVTNVMPWWILCVLLKS